MRTSASVLSLNVLEVGTAMITDVRIDQLLPCQGSRTSLRRSHRSRKQNQPGFRRLRSERYPYPCYGQW